MAEELLQCSRCNGAIKGYQHNIGGQVATAGFYMVDQGYWSKFALPGEIIICDRCMWADPQYIAEQGIHNYE